ncbi:MAG: hypothetical protein RML35_13875 [Chloroherpetonaceae bacterium]|nr:hypothetical protein [Chloroherpetonaceae bacterium]
MFAAIGSAAYFFAYFLIALETVRGRITLGDLTYFTGAFSNMRSLLEGILLRFPVVMEGSLYLRDLFDFFRAKASHCVAAETASCACTYQKRLCV